MLHVLICATPNSQIFAEALNSAISTAGCQGTVLLAGDATQYYPNNPLDSTVYFENVALEIQNSDLVIVEISEPSTELGFEVAYALSMGKSVGCLIRIKRELDSILLGATAPGLSIFHYADMQKAIDWVMERIQLL